MDLWWYLGNDAAIALAEKVGGTVEGFVDLMNKKSENLGLIDTHFVTPHGLDEEEHYTTAFELAKLADYGLKNDIFAKIVKTKNYTININGNLKKLSNTNELLGYIDGVYGIITGFTNGANRCLVSACKRNDLDIITVVLGCDTKKDRGQDSISLINYIFDDFQKVDIREIINNKFIEWNVTHVKNFEINKGINSNVEICLNEDDIPSRKITIRKELLNKIKVSLSFTNSFEAPLVKNTKIGTMDVFLDGEKLFSVDIENKNTIEKKDIVYYIKFFIENYCNYFKINPLE